MIEKEILHRIRQIQIETTKLVEDILAGAYKSAFRGTGMEFDEVRDYQPGDDIRSIDWNVTARMNHPYVKSFREERELTVFLMVDISASARFGSAMRLKKELIAEIAAALAFSAIKNQDRVGLILFTDQVELYVPPKKGVRHVLRVIRELLVFEPQHIRTNIGQALDFLGKVRRKMAVCFLISDFQTNLNFEDELGVNAARHDLVLMEVSDPREETIPQISLVQLQDLETKQMMLIDTGCQEVEAQFRASVAKKRTEIRRLAKRKGVGFVEFQTHQPYEVAIQKYFALRHKEKR